MKPQGVPMSTGERPGRTTQMGAWSLAYLGPGFSVQLRITSRVRGTRLDGFMSPSRPVTVLLVAATDQQILFETSVTDSGRFEFPSSPSGPCRLMFLGPDSDRPFLTPPFWI